MNTKTIKKTNYRWLICAMLFFATTVNYMDRQVLSLTYPGEGGIQQEFGWSDANYGRITGIFSLAYAICNLFAGKFIDWMGTKKGYLWAIFIWSTGAVIHAFCGIATCGILTGNWFEGFEGSKELLRAFAGDYAETALMVSTVSVWLFLGCRCILALGEAGNFPAAIKVTAEYFPKKDRAFATAIFNSGASVGALIAPFTIPVLAKFFGWEMAFIVIGALGYVWMAFWIFIYHKPRENKMMNDAELAYIMQDAGETEASTEAEDKPISFWRCFTFRQTWAFIVGKFMTDGVWWFFLFWTPAYLSSQFGINPTDPLGMTLIFVLYLITMLSILGGKLPTVFINKGMDPYAGRMRAMLIFAFFPLVGLFAQPLGGVFGTPWFPIILIGIIGAAHQSWSANIFSTIGDMFPKSTIATITGIGSMAGGIGSYLINQGSGIFFTYAENTQMQALGFTGKPAAYMIVFCICAVAYLIGWCIMKLLVPKYEPVVA